MNDVLKNITIMTRSIIIFFTVNIATVDAQDRMVYEGNFNREDVPIYESRIYVVPEARRSHAFELLKGRTFFIY